MARCLYSLFFVSIAHFFFYMYWVYFPEKNRSYQYLQYLSRSFPRACVTEIERKRTLAPFTYTWGKVHAYQACTPQSRKNYMNPETCSIVINVIPVRTVKATHDVFRPGRGHALDWCVGTRCLTVEQPVDGWVGGCAGRFKSICRHARVDATSHRVASLPRRSPSTWNAATRAQKRDM